MKGWVDRKWNLGVVLTSLRTRTRRNLEVEVSRKLSPSWVISWHHPPPHQSPTYVAFPPFGRGEGALGVGQLITSSDVWGEMVNRPRLVIPPTWSLHYLAELDTWGIDRLIKSTGESHRNPEWRNAQLGWIMQTRSVGSQSYSECY